MIIHADDNSGHSDDDHRPENSASASETPATPDTPDKAEAADSSEPAQPSGEQLFQTLCDSVKSYMPQADTTVLRRAYEFAAEKHGPQLRQSGEPYITHPVNVAIILTALKVDIASLVAAILHDVVEDTQTSLAEVEEKFGKPVAELVDGMTKIGKIQFRSNQERLAENFRKMIFAMAKDVRVILIKLADRLHNMRTLKHLPAPKRKRIAQETMDIYAPLANRLGIYGIKSELEDLCLRQLKREVYSALKAKVAAKRHERMAYIEEVKTIVEEELRKYGFNNMVVYGRPKHFYSIYKKMVERHLEFEDVHDLFAFRIIVDTVKDCYEALGVVHAMWKPMPGRFKDYIAMPKANMYQSLHTTVIRPNGEPAEFQIRTHEMHDICEYGVAAHWLYKERGFQPGAAGSQGQPAGPGADLKKMSWVRQIIEWQTEIKDPDEFLEAVKVDLFEEEIFVFIPKGDVIQLPAGASALDFAFGVHTQVGQKTIGAKVNGRIVPIKRTLQSGDIVEVLTSPNQKPSKDWLNFVTTSKAKNKIRAFLRSEQRDRSRTLGKDLLAEAFSARGYDYDDVIKGSTDEISKAAKESHLDDALVAVGYGKIDAKELVNRVFPEKNTAKLAESAAIIESKTSRHPTKNPAHGILVSGIDNVLVNFGRCCNPLPGEEILGFITRGRGVTIHRSRCARAIDLDPHRRVPVSWASSEPDTAEHHASIGVVSHDRQGILAEVTSVIASCGANIHRAQVIINPGDMLGHLDFDMTVKSLSQLQAIIHKLEAIPSVVSVERRSTSKQSSNGKG